MQGIIASPAIQHIIAQAAIQRINAAIPDQQIMMVRADQAFDIPQDITIGITARPAILNRIAKPQININACDTLCGKYHAICGIGGNAPCGNHIRGSIAGTIAIASPAIEGICACPASQPVSPCPAGQIIIPRTAKHNIP